VLVKIKQGVRLRPFNYGISMNDATPEQLDFSQQSYFDPQHADLGSAQATPVIFPACSSSRNRA
jgi:hypothetical protein